MNKIVFGVFVFTLSAFPALASGPAEINLMEKYAITGTKSAVIFPHAKHQAKLECVKCHASSDGGKLSISIENKTGVGNDFHKKFCWPCHETMSIPKGKACNTCHK